MRQQAGQEPGTEASTCSAATMQSEERFTAAGTGRVRSTSGARPAGLRTWLRLSTKPPWRATARSSAAALRGPSLQPRRCGSKAGARWATCCGAQAGARGETPRQAGPGPTPASARRPAASPTLSSPPRPAPPRPAHAPGHELQRRGQPWRGGGGVQVHSDLAGGGGQHALHHLHALLLRQLASRALGGWVGAGSSGGRGEGGQRDAGAGVQPAAGPLAPPRPHAASGAARACACSGCSASASTSRPRPHSPASTASGSSSWRPRATARRTMGVLAFGSSSLAAGGRGPEESAEVGEMW